MPFSALLLCAAVSAFAQTGAIRGTVTDAAGEPLVGANVLVKGTVLGAKSGIDGGFLIRKVRPGVAHVQVTMLGFLKDDRTVDVAAEGVAILRIALRESPIETDEVVITAGRRAQSFEEIPVSISLLEGRDVEKRGLISLDQALRYVPGVNMTESQVNIRGSSGYSRALGTRVLMLLDGVPILAGDANEIKYDAVPMYMIERIEVVKGSGSALYGSSALGGVINIITKTPVRESTRARIYSGFYDEPRWQEWKWWSGGPRVFNGVDAQHGDVAGPFSYMVSAGVRNNRGYRQNDDFLRWNANAKASYRIDPERALSAALNIASDDHGNWIYWRDLEHALVPPASADLTERIVSTKRQFSLQYRETASTRFAWSARGFLYRTAFNTSSDTSDFSLRPNDKTQSTANVYGLEWQGTFSLNDRNMLIGGLDGSYTTVASTTYDNRTGYGGAAYLQDEMAVTDQLTLSLGARLDYTKVDTAKADGQINPRIGAAYTPVHGTIFRASYGWGFRAPSIAERFASASGGGLITKPSPGLLSERSTSYEAGVKQELPIPAVIDAAVFLNEYENLVEPLLDPADGKITFENITRARILGFEIGMQASFLDKLLEGAVSYTYMYPRDVTENAILRYRPRHLFYASCQVRIFDGVLGADFRFVSRIEEIDTELGLIIRNAEQRVDAYVTDLRFGWDFARQGLPLRATVLANNVFNYSYSEIVGNVAPIRNFTLSLEAEF